MNLLLLALIYIMIVIVYTTVCNSKLGGLIAFLIKKCRLGTGT